MRLSEFVDLAIHGADTYYKYLKKQNKGLVKYAVLAIAPYAVSDTHYYFSVRIDTPIKKADDAFLMIRERICSPEEACIVKVENTGCDLMMEVNENIAYFLQRTPVQELYFISDLKFLVKRVGEWYTEAGKMLSMPQASRLPAYRPPKTYYAAPSPEQEDAIRSIFEHPITYIWGAPGTGKTKFVLSYALLHAVSCISKKPTRKVLVIAPTNNAIDQTLFGILPILEEYAIPHNKVLRLGAPTSAFYAVYPDVCAHGQLAEEIKALNDAIDSITEEICIRRVEKDFSSLVPEYLSVRDTFRAENAAFLEASRKAEACKERKEQLTAYEADLREQFFKYTSRSYRFWHSITPKQKQALQSNLDHIVAQRAQTATDLPAIESALSEYTQVFSEKKELVEQLRIEHDRSLSRIKELSGSSYLPIDEKEFLLALRRGENVNFSSLSLPETEELEDQICELEQARSEKQSALEVLKENSSFANASVIAGTIDTLIGNYDLFEKQTIVHVFIDEAAYSPLYKSMVAFSFGAPVTMLGDHCQLPPVCEMPEGELKAHPECVPWSQSCIYCDQVFHQTPQAIFEAYFQNDPPPFTSIYKTDLHYTHRFGENLANILSRFVYTKAFHGAPEAHMTIRVIDGESNPIERSRKNPGEAEAVAKYLSDFAPEDVAILTPYRDQVDLLRSKVPIKYKKSVMTIHASQGKEYDTVILSVSDTANKWFTTVLRPSTGGKQVLNTAISRAKKELIIACHEEFWRSQKGELLCALIEQKEDFPL